MIALSWLDAAESGGSPLVVVVVVGPIVIGAIFIVMMHSVPDSKGESSLPQILARVRRGRVLVISRRIAFSRAARLQRARLALDPFRLDPAELDGLDHLASPAPQAARSVCRMRSMLDAGA